MIKGQYIKGDSVNSVVSKMNTIPPSLNFLIWKSSMDEEDKIYKKQAAEIYKSIVIFLTLSN